MTKPVMAAALLIGILSTCSLLLYTYLTPTRPRALILPKLKLTRKQNFSLDSTNLTFWAGVAALADGIEIQDRSGFTNSSTQMPSCLPGRWEYPSCLCLRLKAGWGQSEFSHTVSL